jgi:demethylmenaquinone methyltransferase/2-methoxy-6-polyprenyl-1,4-benzoquinol methylase
MSCAPMNADPAEHDQLLAEQRVFYRQRAPEYDDWWLRRGRYDAGPDEAADWNRQVETVAGELRRFDPVGEVLELAGGTGWWTASLAQFVNTLTVIDSSPEVIALNRHRVRLDHVQYVLADIFALPLRAAAYDVVFFSFWLSHVPVSAFRSFWSSVRDLLRPDGRVFLIDNRRDTARGPDPFVMNEDGDMQLRRLRDGSLHRVVKVFYEPDDLCRRLDLQGWDAQLASTGRFFYGAARPR